MKQYAGKWVYITGGSSGIGKACARAFLREGANVLIISRDSEKLESALLELEKERTREDQRVLSLSVDVSRGEDVREAFSGWLENHPAPDVLITSAGMAYPNYFEKIPDEIFDKTIDVNLKGNWYVIHTLYPHMRATGGGYIVLVSSMAGYIGVFGYTAYSASKYGIIGMASCLRSEAELDNIAVSVLCPPDTDTPQLAEENKTKPEETKAVSGTVKPVSADFVAEGLLKGMRKKRFLITPGLEGSIIEKINRHFPNLVYKINQSAVKKAARKRGKSV
ncbi:SDR family oxidoreductase [Spirochaetia bacterium 38H-sp]|uniref:3-dehydrosphinganine reductase n=1 Tax=Rarispira pelagica TaxID=3141764 RepID=A0ABU9U9Z8_9SPIR